MFFGYDSALSLLSSYLYHVCCCVHESNESLRQVDNVYDVYWKMVGGVPFQVGSFLFKRGVLQ